MSGPGDDPDKGVAMSEGQGDSDLPVRRRYRLPSPVTYESSELGTLRFQSYESVGLSRDALNLFSHGGDPRYLAEGFLTIALVSPQGVDWGMLDDAQVSDLLGWLGQHSSLDIPAEGTLEHKISHVEKGMRARQEESLRKLHQAINGFFDRQMSFFRSSLGFASGIQEAHLTEAIVPKAWRDSLFKIQNLIVPSVEDLAFQSPFNLNLLSQTASLDWFLDTFPDIEEQKEAALKGVGLDVDVLRWEGLEAYIEKFDEVVLDHSPANGPEELAWLVSEWTDLEDLLLSLANQLPGTLRQHRTEGLTQCLHAFKLRHFQTATITLAAQLDGLMGDLVVLDRKSEDRLKKIGDRISHFQAKFRAESRQSSVFVPKGPFFIARNAIAHGDPSAPLNEEMAVRLLLHIVSILAVIVKRHGTGYQA